MKRLTLITLTSLCFFLSIVFPSFSAPPAKAKTGEKQNASPKKQHAAVEKQKNSRTLKAQTPKDRHRVRADRKGSTRTASGHKATRTAQAAVVSEEAETDGDFLEYKVRKGDTLENVALKFGLERDDILESNNNLGKRLAPGRTLLIPKVMEAEREDEYVNLPGKALKSWKTHEEKYMLVKVAKSFMGAPYRYGGDSVRGLDCSAFVKKIYDIFDVQLPRSARDQFRVGPKITKDDLAVGDLVFFRTKRYVKYPTHVGIYIGDGNFIHSSSAHCKIGVRIDSLQSDFYTKTFLGGTRIKRSPDETPDITKNPDLPLNFGHNS
jgi:peptidoglycan DL-endopeptidase LytE